MKRRREGEEGHGSMEGKDDRGRQAGPFEKNVGRDDHAPTQQKQEILPAPPPPLTDPNFAPEKGTRVRRPDFDGGGRRMKAGKWSLVSNIFAKFPDVENI